MSESAPETDLAGLEPTVCRWSRSRPAGRRETASRSARTAEMAAPSAYYRHILPDSSISALCSAIAASDQLKFKFELAPARPGVVRSKFASDTDGLCIGVVSAERLA